jgi:hypothetical protein
MLVYQFLLKIQSQQSFALKTTNNKKTFTLENKKKFIHKLLLNFMFFLLYREKSFVPENSKEKYVIERQLVDNLLGLEHQIIMKKCEK